MKRLSVLVVTHKQAAAGQCALLARAWRETLGGRVSPPQPW